MTEANLTCDLDALSAADRAEHEALSRQLYTATRDVTRSAEGVTLALDGGAEALTLAARRAALETQCCPFWRIELTYEAGSTGITLSGPEAAAPMLDEVAAGFAG